MITPDQTLNLPIVDRISGCQNLLIAGAGGGYDLFCGLPIYFALRNRGQEVTWLTSVSLW